ncbi:DUF2207 domain-containing protein [Candidatus Saccharibacteria bacterium]|nr:DUF2207 domain-containing protein [Candidatus Saccharibacteria bacterium]
MKKWIGVLILVMPAVFAVPVYADVNDFYFSDFTGDYYLSKDAEGISHLKVVENVTAVFPDFNQNKGICRQILFTNQNGVNITLPNLTREDIKVTRNGVAEAIYSIEKENNYYNVCTGTEEYVTGEQVYQFEYEFEKVVTDFGSYQELYWDTNGNGARQRFNKVTARVHFEDAGVWSGKSWCYVGKYGQSGQDRCETTEISDGVEFVAMSLGSYENLTFDVELMPGSYVVPTPEKDYAYVWLAVGVGVLCVVSIGLAVRKFLKSQAKEKYYKGLFVKPEYQPNREYSLAEMTEIYLGKKKDVKVAMLLGLATERKIELQKGEKKKWSILVKKDVAGEYADLLAILNGGTRVKAGDAIEVKRYAADSKLLTLKKTMENKILGDLKKDGLVEDKYRMGSSGGGASGVWSRIFVYEVMVIAASYFLLGVLADMVTAGGSYGKVMVFYGGFYLTVLGMIAVSTAIIVYLNSRVRKYAGHTNRGLEMARYMEGLELYIRMAEAERLKFLQSVKGADTSATGIVRLYEKLLPYAAVFGLEESWMAEMKEYCKVKEIDEPDYLMRELTAYEISRMMRSTAAYATTATMMSSSGGGSSSGFSGGGGGGFSGGGGGGGGFGGR